MGCIESIETNFAEMRKYNNLYLSNISIQTTTYS